MKLEEFEDAIDNKTTELKELRKQLKHAYKENERHFADNGQTSISIDIKINELKKKMGGLKEA